MKIVFKSDDFAGLNYVREYREGFDVDEKSQIRESVGTVDYKGIKSRFHRIYIPGVIFSMFEGSLDNDLVHILESDFPYLQMHFELTTTGCLYFPDAKFEIDTEIYGGTHSILFYPSLKGKLHYLKKAQSSSVEIELSLDFIRRIFNNDLEILREFGENIEKNYPAIMGGKSFPITPGMKHILIQIRDCPYSGLMKKLYVEAKVIELMMMQISQINGLETHKKALKRSDIDRLNEVKELLLRNIYNPYSIEELSRLAGINRTKLQEGFKELFGTTIFGYISDTRLEQARQRIRDGGGETTIAEIAAIAGYKNPQHFTAAFKKKFGFLPKEIKGC